MTLDALLVEIDALRSRLAQGERPSAERFVQLDAAVRASAEALSRPALERLIAAMADLERAAEDERAQTQGELRRLGADRRAVRGYGCLRSTSQGQRLTKKA